MLVFHLGGSPRRTALVGASRATRRSSADRLQCRKSGTIYALIGALASWWLKIRDL